MALSRSTAIILALVLLRHHALSLDIKLKSTIRREIIHNLRKSLAGTVFGFALVGGSSIAAAAASDSQDKANILKGYQRLSYLLDHWDAETTVCGQYDNPYIGENGCERKPDKVMDYLGYKSINDPLFKADKTLRRLEELVPADKATEYAGTVYDTA
jgi:hypothetical protein